MARIRSIKPELLEDEKAAALSSDAWRLWVSMWLLADDFGNLRGDSRRLAAAVFWGVSGSPNISALLRELETALLIELYTVRGQSYVHIRSWDKHQRIDNAGKTSVPKPSEADSNLAETRGEIPRIAAGSGSGSGSGRDLEGKGGDVPLRFSEAWAKQTGGLQASASDLIEASDLCKQAAIAPTDAIAEFMRYREECPADKRPGPTPMKFVQHFARIQERLKAPKKPSGDAFYELAQAKRQELEDEEKASEGQDSGERMKRAISNAVAINAPARVGGK